MPLADAGRRAVRSAAEFLRQSRSPDGLWRDFRTLAGASSDWVSAYVCHAVRQVAELERERSEALRRIVHRQRPNGGWAYNRSVPTDCDSTAWVLIALSSIRITRPSAIRRAVRYTLDHARPSSGGFATYDPQDGIARYIGASTPGDTAGWTDAHPCVTAAAVWSLVLHGHPISDPALQRAREYLLGHRDPSGGWSSYWWEGSTYATYQVGRALRAISGDDRGAVECAVASVRSTQGPDGGWDESSSGRANAFATAQGLLALLLDPTEANRMAAGRAARWLVDAQQPDGAWEPAPILRIPRPSARDPAAVAGWLRGGLGTGVIVPDDARIFSAAAAVGALSAYAWSEQSGPAPELP